MRFSDTLSTAPLLAGEIWRRGHRWMRTGPVTNWWFGLNLSGSISDQWSVAPVDLRPVSPALADDYYAGRYWFSNQGKETRGASPFEIEPPSTNWFDELHSFRWLRHLRAADTELSRAHASSLVDDWIAEFGGDTAGPAWQPQTLSARLIAWAAHAPALLQKSGNKRNKAVRRSMARQARHLQNGLSTLQGNEIRLHASIALVHASLCLSKSQKLIQQAVRDLDREIARQVLADGGHISRNPSVLVDLLIDLVPLRGAFDKLGFRLSAASLGAIDRMSAALRFFQHSNGELATFNGTDEVSPLVLETVLINGSTDDGVERRSQKSAPQTGYERLAAENTVVLMDTGKPSNRSATTRALAGALSFELSSGKNIFIMNCGMPGTGFEKYVPFARSTAAHSTAVIADTSSSRFATDASINSFLPSALLSTPETVTSERTEIDGHFEINASHDGYAAQFNLVHRRVLQLSEDGTLLNGADRFEAVGRPQLATDGHSVALRFHLPPGISASLLASGHTILLAASDHDAWTFTCVDAPIALEESIRFSGAEGPRKTEQIVVNADTGRNPEIRWTFSRRGKKQTTRSRKKANEEPDLLSAIETDI